MLFVETIQLGEEGMKIFGGPFGPHWLDAGQVGQRIGDDRFGLQEGKLRGHFGPGLRGYFRRNRRILTADL